MPNNMAKTHTARGAAGEILRNAKETAKIEQIWHVLGPARLRKPPKKYDYVEELAYLQLEY